MKSILSKINSKWAAYNEMAMAPLAFIVFAVIYALVAWLWQEIPLPGPSRLLGPMFGAFLVFVGWTAGTFSFYWNCRDRFEFLFKSGPENVFQKTEQHSTQLRNRQYIISYNRNGNKIELWNGPSDYSNFELETQELFRCHVLYLWHCSIFVFGLVLSQ